jgi:4-amino-4-deoxy-L-arabinose transferase-like glycosyltransferase
MLLITTVIKLWLAAFFPFIGDEAYFYQWGAHLDWGGYYDHPPMVGWWLWGLQQLSSHPLVLRLPAVMLWIAVTFGMMDLFSRLLPEQSERRWLLGSLFLALPFTWTFNLITTDTPLVLFLFFSGYAFIRAEHEKKWRWYAASGVLLGLALLSKYFAGLLAITYAIYLLPRQGGIARLLLVAVCALPFMLLNLAWNASHCWNNFLFNLINRNQDAHFSFLQVAQYFLMLVYLVTPWTAVALWRSVRASKLPNQPEDVALATGTYASASNNPEQKDGVSQPSHLTVANGNSVYTITALFVVPFSLFLLLSFYKEIGLHWLLGFIPFVFLFAAANLRDETLKRHKQWALWFGLPHLLLILSLTHLPVDVFKSLRLHADIVLNRQGKDVVLALRKDIPADTTLMTPSYSQSSLLAYHAQSYIPVFGFGSFHARFDDPITDFREFDGKNIRIASTRPIDAAAWQEFFTHLTVQERMIDGARFWVADGEGFRFEPYRTQVLGEIANRFYNVPSWLPLYGCRFLEMYDFI